MTIEITEKKAGKTIRELLRGDMGYSSGMLKKLKFTEGGITVNSKFVTVRYVLKVGDILALKTEDREEDTCPYMIPVDLELPVLFEDDHITAVNKPPFMPAHPSFGHRLDTVANALSFRYSGAPYVFRPVNRLDSDTSGIMLTANSRLAASLLYRSMISGEIVKMYIAVLTSAPKEAEGTIDIPLRRCDDSIIKRRTCTIDDLGAKSALTYYKVLYADPESGRCAVLASPVTGRTHQLRVHFAALGCPLCGDSLYGSPCGEPGRQALHAAYLSFPHPESKERIHLFAPPPEDIRSLMPDFDKVLSAFGGSTEDAEKYLLTLKSRASDKR